MKMKVGNKTLLVKRAYDQCIVHVTLFVSYVFSSKTPLQIVDTVLFFSIGPVAWQPVMIHFGYR